MIWVVSVPDILQCMDEKLITEGSRWWVITQQQGRICKLMLWKTYIFLLSYKILEFLTWLSPNIPSAMTGFLALQRSWLCSVLNLSGLISLCSWDAKRFLELHLLLQVLLWSVDQWTGVGKCFPCYWCSPCCHQLAWRRGNQQFRGQWWRDGMGGATETHKQYFKGGLQDRVFSRVGEQMLKWSLNR